MVFAIACEGKKPSQDPELSDAQAALLAGLTYLNDNELEEAEIEFTKLIELAPDEVIGYANLGIVYLRQGKLTDAESYLKKALDLDAENVMLRLNLFDVYEQSDQQENALAQLKKVLEYDPNNIFALYKMSEKSALDGENGSIAEVNQYLKKIIEVAPTNIVPRIYLLEYMLENQQYEQAMEQFEDIQSKFERLPVDSEELFNQAYDKLRTSQPQEAYTHVVMFHNQLKLSNWYQADVLALKGSDESRIGTPVISFSRKMMGFGGDDDNQVYQNITFTDVAENASLIKENKSTQVLNQDLSSMIVVKDLDNDGDQDLFFTSNDPNGSGIYIYKNELGRFQEVTKSTGIDATQQLQHVSFSDYDNDGFLDLLLISAGSVNLFHNVGEFTYQDVTENSGLSDVKDGICTLFFDADHDGDLDLFIGASGPDLLFQNNGNGTFNEVAGQYGIEPSNAPTYEAVLGDFDDDGDTDFFVVNSSGNKLYTNNRLGNFDDITYTSGFDPTDASRSVSVGDYNNDGFSDLFISDLSGQHDLYKNQGEEGFVKDFSLKDLSIENLKPRGHEFFDFDNDGWLDLIISGDPGDAGAKGLMLARNNQGTSFENVSSSLPDPLPGVRSLAIGDYNEDSDLDLFVTYDNGSIGLLRNDGGNMNYQLHLKLVGLREGSGKNNYYGIGSKVEVLAGSLYQMRTISSQNEYFGLGDKERADIIRIRWTNGVPQNIFSPNSDLDLIEQQKLKGSCPFLFTWDGERFAFVKDMMWRSALGMPLGIMATDNSRSYAFPDASQEYLKIPGDMLKIKDDKYQIKITGELWETIYLDKVALYVVDHPAEVDFRLDEKFVLPPFPKLYIYPVTNKHTPVSVTDGHNDVLQKIAAKDHDYIDNFKRSEFQGITELTDLVIDLGEDLKDENLHLFLNGWIFPSDASINVSVSQNSAVTVIPPYLQVINEQGDWETVIDNVGFPLGKNKTVVTELSGIFKTKSRKVRIRTSMQIYWDHIFYAHTDESFNGNITAVSSYEANLQHRGFSAEFRKGDRNGPHWFDYDQSTTDPMWMDLEGYYTRYGDVTPLLDKVDDRYIIYNAGDEVSINYDAKALPVLPVGWNRDFVIYSEGWVKDGDLNTAFGQTVSPLPFHGMSSYPYSDDENYPYEKNSDYIKKYNTRKVTTGQFRNHLKVLK